MSKRLEQHVWITKLAGAVAVGAVSVALVGCGGSSSSDSSTQAAAPASHPQKTAVSSNLDTGVAQAQSAGATSEVGRHLGVGRLVFGLPRRAVLARQAGRGDQGPPRAAGRRSTPPPTTTTTRRSRCRTRASSSACPRPRRSPTARSPAPPRRRSDRPASTSFRAPRAPMAITMALESSSLSQVTKHMAKRHEITVKGRHGLCGKLGRRWCTCRCRAARCCTSPLRAVVGQQFAALALGRLSA